MSKELDIKELLVQLSQISTQCLDQIKANINTYFGEELSFKSDSVVTSRLFAVLVAIEIECIKNLRTFNFEQIEENIYRYLRDLKFDKTARSEAEYYLSIFAKEKTNNLLPLSGIAMSFLHQTVEKSNLNKALDKHTFNGIISPLLMHAVVHEFTVLTALSAQARQLATKDKD